MNEDSPPVDRRQNAALRQMFDEAYERVAPFLDPKQTWGGVPLERLAFRMLREAYPQLSPLETHQLVVASVRVYRHRNPELAAHLPAPEEIALTH